MNSGKFDELDDSKSLDIIGAEMRLNQEIAAQGRDGGSTAGLRDGHATGELSTNLGTRNPVCIHSGVVKCRCCHSSAELLRWVRGRSPADYRDDTDDNGGFRCCPSSI